MRTLLLVVLMGAAGCATEVDVIYAECLDAAEASMCEPGPAPGGVRRFGASAAVTLADACESRYQDAQAAGNPELATNIMTSGRIRVECFAVCCPITDEHFNKACQTACSAYGDIRVTRDTCQYARGLCLGSTGTRTEDECYQMGADCIEHFGLDFSAVQRPAD